MKTIIEKEMEVGGDGAKASGGFYVEEGMLKAKAEIMYPIAKVVDAVVKPLDPLKEKLKALIPGDWDNPYIDKAFDDAKQAIAKMLSE